MTWRHHIAWACALALLSCAAPAALAQDKEDPFRELNMRSSTDKKEEEKKEADAPKQADDKAEKEAMKEAPLSLPEQGKEEVVMEKSKSGAKVFISEDFADPLPKRVVVLPFGFPNGNKIGARTVYQSFRNHFAGLPFGDVEWYPLETALVKLALNLECAPEGGQDQAAVLTGCRAC